MPEMTLRPLRADDAADVLAAFDSDPGMARQGTVTTIAEADAYVYGLLDPAGNTRSFAICDDDRLVGLVAVTVDTANRVGWVWYWMNASHRGRGSASASATAVSNWALRSGGCERLELGHRADNPLSGNVAAAAGFRHEGRQRGKFLIDGHRVDVLTYGRLSTDPWPTATVEIAR